MTCHCCQGETKKSGSFRNKNRFVQRYRCNRCAKTFSESQPLDGVRIETDKAAQVVNMLCEGIGIRAISRLTGLDQGTVLNVLQSAGEQCARLLEAKLKNVAVKDVEIDELYSFVNCLQATTTVNDMERGDQYVFMGIEKNTKLILHYLIGKRDKDNAMKFLVGLKHRVAEGRFQMTSDGYQPYCGSMGAVFRVFRETIDYGTEQKHFATAHSTFLDRIPRRLNPVKCMWVKRTAVLGNPNRKRMTTNHSERCNLSVRLFNRRFTRRTMGFSKTLENHRHSVALMVAHFNFCRVHSAHKQTPAMANGLTDHVWTVGELISATI